MTETLKITELCVAVEGKPILKGVNLTINRGETHALMGRTAPEKAPWASPLWATRITK